MTAPHPEYGVRPVPCVRRHCFDGFSGRSGRGGRLSRFQLVLLPVDNIPLNEADERDYAMLGEERARSGKTTNSSQQTTAALAARAVPVEAGVVGSRLITSS